VDGTGSALISSLYKDGLGLDLKTDFILAISFRTLRDQYYKQSFRLKPAAFLDSSPGFLLSPFPAIMRQDMIMGFTTFHHFARERVESLEDISLGTFMIKMNNDATNADIDTVIAAFRDALAGKDVSIWDYRSTMAPFEVATVAMTYFFNFTTFIAMLISFFFINVLHVYKRL